MDRIYEDYKDVHVSAVIIYASSNKAYTDADHTEQFTTSALLDAFLKGAVIHLNTNKYAIPVGYSEAGTPAVGSITYIVPNQVTSTSADIAALAAVADPA